jgi:hypothetical protein
MSSSNAPPENFACLSNNFCLSSSAFSNATSLKSLSGSNAASIPALPTLNTLPKN